MHTREEKLEAFGRLLDVLGIKSRQIVRYAPIQSRKYTNYVMRF